MRGTVIHVSSQPLPRARGATRFEVKVTLDPLDAHQRRRLRTGMSCVLEIVIYNKDATLMVPTEAVERSGRSHRLRVIDRETRIVQHREVEIGPTTLDSVEITSGLKPGDEIVVPTE